MIVGEPQTSGAQSQRQARSAQLLDGDDFIAAVGVALIARRERRAKRGREGDNLSQEFFRFPAGAQIPAVSGQRTRLQPGANRDERTPSVSSHAPASFTVVPASLAREEHSNTLAASITACQRRENSHNCRAPPHCTGELPSITHSPFPAISCATSCATIDTARHPIFQALYQPP